MEKQEQVATREEAAPAFRLDLGPEAPIIQPHQVRTAWPQPPERGARNFPSPFSRSGRSFLRAGALRVLSGSHTSHPLEGTGQLR